jgi:hypothetical protein
MVQTSLYGEFQSEKLANESQIARQIVKEINNFGINERQRWLIIHSLALELENQEDMRELIGFIKESKGDSLFLSTIKEG